MCFLSRLDNLTFTPERPANPEMALSVYEEKGAISVRQIMTEIAYLSVYADLNNSGKETYVFV